MVAAVLSLLIKQYRPELSSAIPVIAAAAIFAMAAPYLRAVIAMFEDIADQVGMESASFRIVIKMIGAAYITQFAAEMCKDAGEGAIASKIELGGKILILTMSMPILYRLLALVSNMINFS